MRGHEAPDFGHPKTRRPKAVIEPYTQMTCLSEDAGGFPDDALIGQPDASGRPRRRDGREHVARFRKI